MANIKFEATEKETESVKKWSDGHRKTCRFWSEGGGGAIGGVVSYVFTPTSIGTAFSALCACGERYNATDYDEW